MINTCAAVMATSLRNTEIDALVAALKSGFAEIKSGLNNNMEGGGDRMHGPLPLLVS